MRQIDEAACDQVHDLALALDIAGDEDLRSALQLPAELLPDHNIGVKTNLCAKIDLPIFSAAYGQIDMGGSYRFNDHYSLSVQASNVNDAIPKALQGGYPNGALYNRSWFMTDRSVDVTLRISYESPVPS